MTMALKQKIGAAVIDWPRFEWHLRGFDLPGLPTSHWTRCANRHDQLETGPGGLGVERAGRWTSPLHAVGVFPMLGTRLMRAALGEWPIEMADCPAQASETPDVSFVIGHRGMNRLPHLLKTLESIAGQRGVKFECVVVEQSLRPEIGDRLPDWVRLVRTTPPDEKMPYARSWAFNVGSRAARGRLLLLHDNDMLIPARYAAEALGLYEEGWAVANLKRFVFYLSQEESRRWVPGVGGASRARLDAVVQNLEGGGSLAIGREAFFEIGGFDEGFVGWGGEDNEFWERASQCCRAWSWGYLPIVHLWHPPQPEKGTRERETARILDERSRLPVDVRVAELAVRQFGRPDRLDPPWSG